MARAVVQVGMTRRSALFSLALGLGLSLALAGCSDLRRSKVPSGQVVAPFAYPDGPEGLRRLFGDILAACQKDERGRVHDLMASLALTREELDGLLGPARAERYWPRYQMLIGTLANVGAIELVAQVIEKKYDDVAVVRVDQLPAAEQQPTDQKVLAALARKVPVYTVRVKKKEEQKGLRYEFFVYLDGRWRTGNLLGKFLE